MLAIWSTTAQHGLPTSTLGKDVFGLRPRLPRLAELHCTSFKLRLCLDQIAPLSFGFFVFCRADSLATTEPRPGFFLLGESSLLTFA